MLEYLWIRIGNAQMEHTGGDNYTMSVRGGIAVRLVCKTLLSFKILVDLATLLPMFPGVAGTVILYNAVSEPTALLYPNRISLRVCEALVTGSQALSGCCQASEVVTRTLVRSSTTQN